MRGADGGGDLEEVDVTVVPAVIAVVVEMVVVEVDVTVEEEGSNSVQGL